MIARATTAVRRTSVEPAAIRLGGFLAGLAALLVATPAGLPRPVVVAMVGLATLPALLPHGPWATVVVLAAVAGWLADTGLTTVAGTGTDGRVADPGRLLLLAGLLYLLHALTALAATLPYDAVVAPEVLTRWLVRALGVVLASSLLSAVLLLLLG